MFNIEKHAEYLRAKRTVKENAEIYGKDSKKYALAIENVNAYAHYGFADFEAEEMPKAAETSAPAAPVAARPRKKKQGAKRK